MPKLPSLDQLLSATPTIPKPAFTKTPEQLAAIEAATTTTDNLMTVAVAGGTKTTTLCDMSQHLNDALFIAFNKRIVDDLQPRIGQTCLAATINSVCHRALGIYTGRRLFIDTSKLFKIQKDLFSYEQSRLFPDLLNAAKALRQAGWAPSIIGGAHRLEHDPIEVLDEADIELPKGREQQALSMVSDLLTSSIRRMLEGYIDFDDQIYSAVLFPTQLPRPPVLIADEVQDFNASQHYIISRMVGSRFIGAGDDRQSIYGFRGAVSGSLAMLAHRFNCRQLPLTVSFRCSRAVVARANEFVPYMQAAPKAREGSVITLPEGATWLPSPGEAVLCRNNAPLFSLAMKLIALGIPTHILGKEFGQGLVKLFNNVCAHRSTVEQMLGSLQDYLHNESMILRASGKTEKLERLEEKVLCLSEVIGGRATEPTSTLLPFLYSLFSVPVGETVLLSTIHKAKGMEWNTVYLLDYSLIFQRTGLDDIQSQNLAYVGMTRAQEHLRFVSSHNPVSR